MYVENLFGEIPEKAVTFLISTSGDKSLYQFTKDHMIETLSDCASDRSDFMFNVILYNDEVITWSDQLVECSSITINSVARWMRDVQCRKGNDLFYALKNAFRDDTEAIYLVINNMPTQSPDDIIEHVLVWGQGRPIHCIAVVYDEEDVHRPLHDFLNMLSISTKGSFHIATMSNEGRLEDVKKVYNAIYTPITGSKACSVETSLNNSTKIPPELTDFDLVPPALRTYDSFLMRPSAAISSFFAHRYLNETPVASIVSRGTRVLARKEKDGYYYLGTIAQEVDKHHSHFLVQFDRSKSAGLDLCMQVTPLHDIITYYDAKRHSVLSQDKVLAPWDVQYSNRYGPGQVIQGVDQRSDDLNKDDGHITVTFWNGKTVQLRKGVAIWIPEPIYERIVLELQMPVTAYKNDTYKTKKIIDSKVDHTFLGDECRDFLWPLSAAQLYLPLPYRGLYYIPTYPLSFQLAEYWKNFPYLYFNPPLPLYPKSLLPYRRRYPVKHEKIEGSDLTADDLYEIVDKQLHVRRKKGRRSSSSSSSSSSDSSSSESYGSDLEFDESKFKLTEDKCVGTRDRKKLKKRIVAERPEWKKYWPQTPQPRLHHQPEFRKQNQTLYSTWQDPDFGSYGDTNTRSMFEPIDRQGIKSDRAAMIDNIHHPYVTYDNKFGPGYVNNAEFKAQQRADFKRSKTLMRLGSDYEKQRAYEEKLRNTIDAKAKINQEFHERFYQKEMDAFDKRNGRQAWLNNRSKQSAAENLQKAQQLDTMQQRQQMIRQRHLQQHNMQAARQDVIDTNYDAAMLAKKQNTSLHRRENRLTMERAHTRNYTY